MGKKRRPRGSGGLRFDAGRGLWVGRVPVGRYPSGLPRYREVTDRTQAGCLSKMRAVGPATGDAVTVEAWADRWLAGLGVRASTRADYTDSLRTWILPAVGALRVADVKPSHFELLAAKMATAGRATGTARKVLSHARILFGAAVRDGLIPQNPVSLARKPKRGGRRVEPYTPAELARIVADGTAHRTARVVALLAATGCRAGEAVALDVADYDPATGMLSITKTYSRKFGTRPPKSANGVRTIRVPEQARAALVAAVGGRRSGPLFTTGGGRRLIAERVRDGWGRVVRRLGLPYRKPHALRHSYCTHAIAAGVAVADLAKYVGDTPQTVMQTYCHASGADPSVAMERLLG